MKKRVTSLLVLLTMLLSATSVMAYDWSQMRGEVDVRYKNKDERGGVDGSGGATRAFHEQREKDQGNLCKQWDSYDKDSSQNTKTE